MMNTKKMISSAVLAASLTFSTGAAFAWAGCGAGPMMGYGPGCQVRPQEVYPGCQYRTGTLRHVRRKGGDDLFGVARGAADVDVRLQTIHHTCNWMTAQPCVR